MTDHDTEIKNTNGTVKDTAPYEDVNNHREKERVFRENQIYRLQRTLLIVQILLLIVQVLLFGSACVVAGATIKYTGATLDLVNITKKEMQITHASKLVPTIYRIKTPTTPLTIDSINLAIKNDTFSVSNASKGFYRESYLKPLNTAPLFTCTVINGSDKNAILINLWIFDKDSLKYCKCGPPDEELKGNHSLFKFSTNEWISYNDLLTSIRTRYNKLIADSVAHKCAPGDVSYLLLLFQDEWNGTYFSQRVFSKTEQAQLYPVQIYGPFYLK